MEKKLEVKDLRLSFRTAAGNVQAVRNISFDLYKGETLAIVGESGSGKSVTNKAIMGISANNAIIESGEILYDGMDLLAISEEDFHKLRGDKISMIFQDPLSALDPINRIGGQMTEAMILKNRANRREGRKAFNSMMSNLLEMINVSMGVAKNSEQGKRNAKKCRDFNTFEVLHLKLEGAFADAQSAANVGYEECHDLLFLIEKNAVEDLKYVLSLILKSAHKAVHRYVLDESVVALAKSTVELLKIAEKSNDWENAQKSLAELEKVFEGGLNSKMPNYFAFAYYQTFADPTHSDYLPFEELDKMSVSDMNAYLRSYLDAHFMLDFIETAKKGITYSHNLAIENKKKAVSNLKSLRNVFANNKPDKKEFLLTAKKMIAEVDSGIDRLQLVKDSLAYTFSSSLVREINLYFDSIPANAKETKRFNKDKSKFDALVAKGKTPSYKVVPAKIIDLNLEIENILVIVDRLINRYENQIAVDDFDADIASVAMIDYLKEKAQIVAHRVTKAMAKERALNLMEEVGIPEPRRRYRQYPFEFSGGMRQRIVIAIALASNPDILICDEPTTALDVSIQSQILELINKIKKERNISVIFITHDLGVVANMADRVAVMYAGKIVEMGTVSDIFYEPAHPYTWALLSSMPDLNTNEKLEAIPGTPPNMIYPPKGDAFAARNKYAMKIDFEVEPPMFDISETHKAATWLLHPSAPKVEIPKQVRERIERMKALTKASPDDANAVDDNNDN